jgi:hypothetical protein
MLAGVGIGGRAVQSIHAQAKPPAYYIVEIDVKNEDIFSKEWAPKADQTIKDAGAPTLCAVQPSNESRELLQSGS